MNAPASGFVGVVVLCVGVESEVRDGIPGERSSDNFGRHSFTFTLLFSERRACDPTISSTYSSYVTFEVMTRQYKDGMCSKILFEST